MSNIININDIPVPNVIEALDFEEALQIRIDIFLSFYDGEEKIMWAKRLKLESEPVLKDLQTDAYFDVLERQRLNNAAKALMLPYSKHNDLDNLVALFGIKRLVVQEADESVIPPVQEILESDERLLERQQLKLFSLSTAGPIYSYKYHALSASAQVLDVDISQPIRGTVLVSILPISVGKQADSHLIEIVREALNEEHIRPLDDTVEVCAAKIIPFSISANIITYKSVLKAAVINSAKSELNRAMQSLYKLGYDVTLSEINRALKQNGVKNVEIKEPLSDIKIKSNEVAHCIDISITAEDDED